MRKKIAINGFGRIGRLAFRELIQDDNYEIVAINDLSNAEDLAYLLKYDSVHGRLDANVGFDNNVLLYNDKRINVYSERDAEKLPWEDLSVDLVLEATGVYTKLEDASKHIKAGAKHVIISAPGKGEMKTIVYGVNQNLLDGSESVISAASCTTNCLAPILKTLDDKYGINMGYMTTVHAYTNDQVNLDITHKKGYKSRRGRACGLNMIPTSTGAAKAIGKVIPKLEGKLSGIAVRVPIADGSMIDLTLKLNSNVTVEDINTTLKLNESESLRYTDDPIVSSDIIGYKTGAVVDGLSTNIVESDGMQLVKVIAWYDNEYGYTSQMIRTIKYFLNLK